VWEVLSEISVAPQNRTKLYDKMSYLSKTPGYVVEILQHANIVQALLSLHIV